MKNERDRVANMLMEDQDRSAYDFGGKKVQNDMVLVRDLVKKYHKKDPSPQLDEL